MTEQGDTGWHLHIWWGHRMTFLLWSDNDISVNTHISVSEICSLNILWNYRYGRVLNEEAYYTHRKQKLFLLHLFRDMFHKDFRFNQLLQFTLRREKKYLQNSSVNNAEKFTSEFWAYIFKICCTEDPVLVIIFVDLQVSQQHSFTVLSKAWNTGCLLKNNNKWF